MPSLPKAPPGSSTITELGYIIYRELPGILLVLGYFIALPPMSSPHTTDGVHLNRAGYLVWERVILEGVSTICEAL